MLKDFDKWNNLKKKIELREKRIFCKPRDVWWCYLGINIGSESCGKNDLFERPVLVLKILSKSMALVVPFTTQIRGNRLQVVFLGKPSEILTNQIKVVSTRRLSRKLTRLDRGVFNRVIIEVINILN